MPRRESYLTDDDDDTRRAAASGGGGIPAWVWVMAGGGALALVVVFGLGFFAFSARREAAAHHEAARADMMQAEAMARPTVAGAGHGHGGMAPKQLPVQLLMWITNAYKNDRAAAEVRYTNQRVRVRVEVKTAGEGWAGTSADVGFGDPGRTRPNVLFWFDDGELVEAGTTVVIEGDCAGLTRHGNVGQALVFNSCRVVQE